MDDRPGMELWRDPERMTFSEAGWLGAAWGICMHAILSFFVLWIDGLEVVLALFRPAERLAFVVAGGGPPFVRYVALLASLATFWALVAVALTAGAQELKALLRERRASAV